MKKHGSYNTDEWQVAKKKRPRGPSDTQNENCQTSDSENSWEEESVKMSEGEVKAFMCLNDSEKLLQIFTKIGILDDIKNAVKGLKRRVGRVEENMCSMQSKLTITERRLKLLEYKAIDKDAQSRRLNLLFWGVEEKDDPVTDLINALSYDLDVEESGIVTQVQRLGKPRQKGNTHQQTVSQPLDAGQGHRVEHKNGNPQQEIASSLKPRPLLASFKHQEDVRSVLKEAKALKSRGISVAKDYPEEIRRARETLWPDLKSAKKSGKEAFIAFPAKLIVDKRVVADLYPDWGEVLYPGPPRSNSQKTAWQPRPTGPPNFSLPPRIWQGVSKADPSPRASANKQKAPVSGQVTRPKTQTQNPMGSLNTSPYVSKGAIHQRMEANIGKNSGKNISQISDKLSKFVYQKSKVESETNKHTEVFTSGTNGVDKSTVPPPPGYSDVIKYTSMTQPEDGEVANQVLTTRPEDLTATRYVPPRPPDDREAAKYAPPPPPKDSTAAMYAPPTPLVDPASAKYMAPLAPGDPDTTKKAPPPLSGDPGTVTTSTSPPPSDQVEDTDQEGPPPQSAGSQ
jgi:hypothetical protein